MQHLEGMFFEHNEKTLQNKVIMRFKTPKVKDFISSPHAKGKA
jgi:hypothetical protein